MGLVGRGLVTFLWGVAVRVVWVVVVFLSVFWLGAFLWGWDGMGVFMSDGLGWGLGKGNCGGAT